jgi:hypothetical protein
LKGKTMQRAFVRSFAPCIIFLAAMLAMPAAHAGRNTELPQFNNEVIVATNAPNATQETHAAILKAAQQREWLVVSNTPAVIRLNLNVRNQHSLTIDVKIKGNSVDVVYVSSENLNYEKRENGQELIHPKYRTWVSNLLKSARVSVQ